MRLSHEIGTIHGPYGFAHDKKFSKAGSFCILDSSLYIWPSRPQQSSTSRTVLPGEGTWSFDQQSIQSDEQSAFSAEC